MKSINSCYCECHDQGIWYCERCKRQHDYERSDLEIQKERIKKIRFRKKRKRL